MSRPRDEGVTLADVKAWLNSLAPERCEDYEDWVSVLMALHHQFAGTEHQREVLVLATEWSIQSPKYQQGDVEEKWGSFTSTGTRAEITIRSLRRWAAEDGGYRRGYPVIDCTVSSETTLTLPTWHAIATQNAVAPVTYWSNGCLGGLRPRQDGTLYVTPFIQDTLSQHLAEKVAEFRRLNRARVLTPCYPPPGLIKQLLANPTPPVDLPKLRRVVPVPVFAANGELITTPGYHKASSTFYSPPSWLGELRPVPERPTVDHVQAALQIFDEHIGSNFPFDDDEGASRAHALTLALQGFAVDVIDQIMPLFDVEAAQRRTGKGLLTECCLMPAFGPTLVGKRTPMPKSDEEMIKVLTALFKDSGLVMAFDNVRGSMDFPSLEAALTAESFEGRVLGSSLLVQATNRATFVVISNNPEMSGDLAGRAVRIRLISPVEFPEDRTDFVRHQPGHTRKHLGELIWALHTLVNNWFAAGCTGPAPGTPGLGSYPRWREVMGGILHAAEVEGFLRNRGTHRREASRAEMQWRDFVRAWLERHGEAPVVTGDLVALADEFEITFNGDDDRARATALGMRLSKCAGIRYFDRYTVERIKRGGDRMWSLVDNGVSAFEAVQ